MQKDVVGPGRRRGKAGPRLPQTSPGGSGAGANINKSFSKSPPFGSKRIIVTISIPEQYEPLLETGERIRRVEGWKSWRMWLEGLAMLVNKKQGEINPQVQLNGSHVTFTNVSESKVKAGIIQLRKHDRLTYRDIAKIVPNYQKTQISEICKPLKKFKGKGISKVSLNKMKERFHRWLLGLDDQLFEPQRREKKAPIWKSCTKPVTPKCDGCPDHYYCPRYREEAP